MLAALEESCGPTLIDRHADPDHHRSVFTLAGDPVAVLEGAKGLARAALSLLDLAGHHGAHPRIGVLDVVPFVPLGPHSGLQLACLARNELAQWAGRELELPCFFYGPLATGTTRSLPTVRRHAFTTLFPDTGPRHRHPSAGATAVGAREVLVAYNLWIEGGSRELVRSVARSLRSEHVRALGFALSHGLQVSCNLLHPERVGPAHVNDAVTALLSGTGAHVARCELVGLVPSSVLHSTPKARWKELDLSVDRTIEARLEAAGSPSP